MIEVYFSGQYFRRRTLRKLPRLRGELVIPAELSYMCDLAHFIQSLLRLVVLANPSSNKYLNRGFSK